MEDIDRMLSSFSITFALSSGLYRPFFLVCVAIHASSCVDYFEFSFIGSKQVAARDAERAKFIVEKAEQDKKSAVIRAEGEATSAQLIGQAIANNPAFITLRKIEAAREIAHTISNSANKVFLDSSDLLLNLQKMELENPRNK
uniref:Prohibitin n=1 Tax=Populus alba TaxID=43335 RepID=A0A4U5Q110_POPAL|nr:prohibitin-1, mitochondrial isoform X1 [Populus alba]